MVDAVREFPEAVVDFLRRYHLATAELLAAQGTGHCHTIEAAAEMLEELAHRGWLRRTSLLPGGDQPCIYTATAKIAQRLGESELAAPQLALDERLARWAIARFCAGGQPFRQLMTAAEFAARFPDLAQAGEPRRYYLEPVGEVTRLAFLKVDLGGASQWDRVVDACCRFLSKRLDGRGARAELFRQLLAHGRFQISLLVACAEKAEAIDARLDLDAADSGTRPPVVPYVVPGLLELLVRSPLKTPVANRRASNRRARRSA